MEAYRERDAMGRERVVYRTVEQARLFYGPECGVCGHQGGRLYDDMDECPGVEGCAKKQLESLTEDEMERARR
jgi:hypothetical protein